MKLIRIMCGVLVVFGGTLGSCQNSQTRSNRGEDTLTVKHKLGSSDVPAHPSRIVVLDIGALETLHELGVTPIAVPKKYMPEYLSDIKNDAAVGDVGSVIDPDFEAIHAMDPDLILISTRQERYYQELRDIAPTVFIGTDNKDYLPSFIDNTLLLAQMVGKDSLAQEKLDTLKDKIQRAQDKFEQDPHKALFLIYNNGRFSAYGKSSRFGFIHDVLHIKPVMETVEESVHGRKVSNEFIAEANPDYLFIIDRNAVVLGKKSNKSDIENILIQQTNAYKNKHIFYLNPNVWFISGGGLISVDLMVDDILRLLP